MLPEADAWFARRTSRASDWPIERLLSAKGATTVSLILPALNEASTVGPIVTAARRALVDVADPLVDELVVIDSGSTDATAAIARGAGATVVDVADVLPDVPWVAGKGEALWRSLAATCGDVVVFVDSDLLSFEPFYVTGLLGPLLTDPRVSFVKAAYDRALDTGGEVQPTGGGRVTELVARPLINLHWPQLAGVVQPLAGEYAARRSLLEQLPFATGYGVELALLIDAERLAGLDALAQVDLGQRQHRHHDSRRLGRMAAEIWQTALARLHIESHSTAFEATLTQFERTPSGYRSVTHEVSALERRPMSQLLGNQVGKERSAMTHARILYSDLDGTMVGRGGSFFRGREFESTTLRPAEALVALHEGGVVLSLVSGRTRAQLQEAARIFGADGFIAEMGAIIGWDRGRRSAMLAGEAPPEFSGPLVAQLESVGLVDDLLASFDGRLEHHAPWHLGHETDVMLHGLADTDEVNKWLANRGFEWLVFVDNGRLTDTVMDGIDERPHIYHLMARGLGKGPAIAVDLERRGLTSSDAVAVGDSLSDLGMAPFVSRFFLVSNGAEVPSIREAAEALPNVTICREPLGSGWAEAAHYCAAP